jgi:hypothetical protein
LNCPISAAARAQNDPLPAAELLDCLASSDEILVEVSIEEMFGSDRSRPRLQPWSSVRSKKKTNEGTLRSERRSALKQPLTEQTLLEMFGNRVYQALDRNRVVRNDEV